MCYRRLIGAVVSALLIALLIIPAAALAADPPEITAASAVLLERDTGRVLYDKNAHEKRPMASTTKIMTAIVALENGNLQERFQVSHSAACVEGSSIWLEPGETKSLEELLYGLMLRSGNDAAVAIAEHIGGSVPEFAAMMTEKAVAVGAKNTSFRNPHGLDAEGHYTTAYDLGLIAAYALKNPMFRKIVTTPQITISWPGQQWDRTLRNQNKLLEIYEGGDGVKTGWTTPAGRCFVGSATREGMQLVTVVLNAPDMWNDATTLLDYGFANFNPVTVIAAGRSLKTARVAQGREEWVPVVAGSDLILPLARGEEKQLSYSFDIQEPLQAPITEGDEVGSLTVSLPGETIGRVELVAGENVPKARFLEPLLDFFSRVLGG